MEINKAYKFRVYPTEKQRVLIAKTFGCVRFVFNFCLQNQMKDEDMWKLVDDMVQQGCVQENQYRSRCFRKQDGCHTITELKSRYEWLHEADNTALQSAADARDSVYSTNGGHPKLKSKRNPVVIQNKE